MSYSKSHERKIMKDYGVRTWHDVQTKRMVRLLSKSNAILSRMRFDDRKWFSLK
jgi:hypothetical protein